MFGLIHFTIRKIINSNIPEFRFLVIFFACYPVIQDLNDLLRKFECTNSYKVSEKLSAQDPLSVIDYYHTFKPVASFCDHNMIDQNACLFWYLPV